MCGFAGSERSQGTRRYGIFNNFIESFLHATSGQNRGGRLSKYENPDIRTPFGRSKSFWAKIFWDRLNGQP